MKLGNWVQFGWDLSDLPVLGQELPEHYQIGPAGEEEAADLRKVISSSFVLDPSWNADLQEVTEMIDGWLARAFESNGDHTCIALRHGTRIIGASVLCLDPEAENHLAPGPCIQMEYRNRSFGTLLLEHALTSLREAGLSHARTMAKEQTAATRFLYPKFNGASAPHNFTPLLAA